MAVRRQPPLLIGDRVRSYALPGVSDSDYITGIVMGTCEIGGLPRVIVESVSRVTRGQADPCRRIFFEPREGIVFLGKAQAFLGVMHRVA